MAGQVNPVIVRNESINAMQDANAAVLVATEHLIQDIATFTAQVGGVNDPNHDFTALEQRSAILAQHIQTFNAQIQTRLATVNGGLQNATNNLNQKKQEKANLEAQQRQRELQQRNQTFWKRVKYTGGAVALSAVGSLYKFGPNCENPSTSPGFMSMLSGSSNIMHEISLINTYCDALSWTSEKGQRALLEIKDFSKSWLDYGLSKGNEAVSFAANQVSEKTNDAISWIASKWNEAERITLVDARVPLAAGVVIGTGLLTYGVYKCVKARRQAALAAPAAAQANLPGVQANVQGGNGIVVNLALNNAAPAQPDPAVAPALAP
jgi:hypothetical protein